MTTPTILLALAEWVEREAPTDELVVAIAKALGCEQSGLWWRPTNESQWDIVLPNWLTSVDAATTLLPEHISYELTWSAAGEGAMRHARLWDWRHGPRAFDPSNHWEGMAKTTLAAALTAAALRALAKETEDG